MGIVDVLKASRASRWLKDWSEYVIDDRPRAIADVSA